MAIIKHIKSRNANYSDALEYLLFQYNEKTGKPILDDSGRIVFNEVNTIPGFTTHSRFPNMLKAAHISFEQIISIAISRALSEASQNGDNA